MAATPGPGAGRNVSGAIITATSARCAPAELPPDARCDESSLRAAASLRKCPTARRTSAMQSSMFLAVSTLPGVPAIVAEGTIWWLRPGWSRPARCGPGREGTACAAVPVVVPDG